MSIFTSPQSARPYKPCCITVGNFDGVHVGHQYLVHEALALANESRLELMAVTFWPHPDVILRPQNPHAYLTTEAEKLELLKNLGVDAVLEIPFSSALACLSPEEFIKQWLLPLHVKKIVIGHDFSFGRDRSGAPQVLRDLGKKYNFDVFQIRAFEIDGLPVSSSRLRRCIANGDVQTAQKLLGRPYSLSGKVKHGFARGGSLGFPTANLEYFDKLLPAVGVYAGEVRAGGKKYRAVTNIGSNPTFDGKKISVESYLLDARIDLYDQCIQVDFLERIRGEKKFSSPAELARQIALDVEQARRHGHDD